MKIRIFRCAAAALGLLLGGVVYAQNMTVSGVVIDDSTNEPVAGAAIIVKGTSSPSDLGTGLKASVTVYLPALSKTRNTRKIFDAISSFGMSVRGINSDNNQNQGYIYKISNKQTLGITENEIIKNLKVITNTVIEQERQARKLLTKDIIDLEDEIYRSYGIFTNARKISYDESINLLSNIKLGVDLGILDNLTDTQVQKLYLYTKPANLQKYLGEKYERIDRDIKRAEVIKQIINEK